MERKKPPRRKEWWPKSMTLNPPNIQSQEDLIRHEKSRMAGFLDCLRLISKQGLPEQSYVDYLTEKTREEPVPLMDWLRVKLKESL